jgi:hypothetical protein
VTTKCEGLLGSPNRITAGALPALFLLSARSSRRLERLDSTTPSGGNCSVLLSRCRHQLGAMASARRRAFSRRVDQYRRLSAETRIGREPESEESDEFGSWPLPNHGVGVGSDVRGEL